MAADDFWRTLYRDARSHGRRLSGLYHDNYVLTRDGDRYVVRVPRTDLGKDVEPRMFDEGAVLAALPAGLPVPELRHRSAEPAFLVTGWCPGRPLHETHPPGTVAPAAVPRTLAAVFDALYGVRFADLAPPLPASPWSRESAGGDFIGGLLSWLDGIHRSATADERRFLGAVGLPSRPFAPDAHAFHGARRRPRLCHGDLQRPNFLVRADGCHLIDWELAVWADPLWDVAAHLHRAGYPPAQEAEVLPALLATVPEWTGAAADRADYASYLRIERLRSLVLDALRHVRDGSGWAQSRRRSAVREYRGKLAVAGIEMDARELWELHLPLWRTRRGGSGALREPC